MNNHDIKNVVIKLHELIKNQTVKNIDKLQKEITELNNMPTPITKTMQFWSNSPVDSAHLGQNSLAEITNIDTVKR